MNNKINSNEIRSKWIKFFEEKNHYYIPSSSLIPVNDKSLLWINAGISTLKSYFDGSEQPPSKRMVNYQKVIRTADIENVGITTTHHTFFEMLGNFSIGDYFKKEAIEYGWELLTSKKWFGIEKDLLYVTIFNEDKEAFKLWKSVGLSENNIFRMGKDTNFWDMGKGPCGPSTEIFYDKGLKYDNRSAKELISLDIDNDRYVEIWNIVFSEFNNDGNGNYKELPQKNIDTGAGLERIVSILQDKPSNFETDIFEEMIKKIESKSKFVYLYDYIPSKLVEINNKQFYINSYYKKIVDYIRSVSFAISDGAMPESSGRGYILRMLLRKAIINRTKLGIEYNFLHELVDPLIKTMGKIYPNLIEKRDLIIETIKMEEDQFGKTLSSVVKKLNQEINDKTLNERSAYKLHETYGLPLELLEDLSNNNKNIKLNWKKIKEIDLKFKEMSKANLINDAMKIQDDIFINLGKTKFIGYKEFSSLSKVIFIFENKVVFDKTPFYATSGGQESDYGKANEFNVEYVEKNSDKTFIHLIPNHDFKVGDIISLNINKNRRNKLTLNHSATHLLFSAIEKFIGTSISQQGSKVEEDFLRFDFSYQKKFEEEDLLEIQRIANKWINDGVDSETKEISLEDAKNMEVSFLERTKYEEVVRVVKLTENCINMCGGTHVKNTKNIEEVYITKLEKRGSGTWRLEAITGRKNIVYFISKKNSIIKENMLNPVLKKIESINSKMKEINIDEYISFTNEINLLDINKIDYKNKLQILCKDIKNKIQEKNILILSKIEKNVRNKFINKKIYIFESNIFNVQEVSKLFLNIIDQTNGDMGVIISTINEKISISFILNLKNINETNIERIMTIAKKYNLRGNGKKQQYIFGGKIINIKEIIEEVTKWEF